MRWFRSFAVLAALLSAVSTSYSADPFAKKAPASPGVNSAAASTPSVVVLDVVYVFKNHARFKQRMDKIRSDMTKHDQDVSAERQLIIADGSRLKDFRTGSAEYKEIEDRARRKLADLQMNALSRKNKILDREGRIYYETYQEIVAAVTLLAKRHNLSLVIRYDSEETDKDDRGSVLKAISRDVVYQQGLDISKLVLELVNGTSIAKGPDAATNTR